MPEKQAGDSKSQRNAENSISKHLNFTISWWSMSQDPQEAHTFATRKIRLPPTFPMGTSTQWNIYFKTYWQHCYSTSGVQVYRSNRDTCLTVNIIQLRECRTVEQRCNVLTARPREQYSYGGCEWPGILQLLQRLWALLYTLSQWSCFLISYQQ